MILNRIMQYAIVAMVFVGLISGRQQGGTVSGTTVKIGYMLCNSEAETTARFRALTNYLTEKIGVNFEFVPVDTHEMEKRFKSG